MAVSPKRSRISWAWARFRRSAGVPPHPGGAPRKVAPGLLLGSHQHVLEHGQPGQNLRELESPDHATLCHPIGRHADQHLPVEGVGAMVGKLKAGEQVEQRRLPRAVWADDRRDRVALDFQMIDVDRQRARRRPGSCRQWSGPDRAWRPRVRARLRHQPTSARPSSLVPSRPCGRNTINSIRAMPTRKY